MQTAELIVPRRTAAISSAPDVTMNILDSDVVDPMVSLGLLARVVSGYLVLSSTPVVSEGHTTQPATSPS
ncbi:hypothetical protein [Streptomyces sp. IBSBF 2806]|uniref:hypothetical protein n=1 Tax=Streptomyces sp. IBSBF 2806 TaxID=2903529 RepID=UPI002FDC309B